MSEACELSIGLVGYGEVGKILTAALVERKVAWVGAWDVLFADASAGQAMKAHAARAGVEAVGSMAALTARADVIVSAVTASQAWSVADEAARTTRRGTWFMDLNSCSPGTKQRSSQRIDGAGGRYVESAVMTTVPQYGIRVPMLLGGRDAAALKALLEPLGFSMEVEADRVGVASAIKMCRSVIVKGMEAIVIESFTAARRYGVEKQVLASLAETFPGMDWERNGDYFFSRVIQHGKRRAEEMREAAATVREVGLEPFMASAIADRQQWVADLAQAATFADAPKDEAWRAQVDRIPRE